MVPVEQKLLTGTYRKDRDEGKEDGANINAPRVQSFPCPREIKSKKAWNQIVPVLCGMGIVFEHDKEKLLHAFQYLDEANFAKEQIDLVRKVLIKEPDNKDALLKYKTMNDVRSRSLDHYNTELKDFLVSPKDRMKMALEVFREVKKEKSAMEDFLED